MTPQPHPVRPHTPGAWYAAPATTTMPLPSLPPTNAPGFICGPTAGCGKVTPMVWTGYGWTLPTLCMHCGKVSFGSMGFAP